ncbi:hypothetical protein BLS995_05490 [Bifidobacterium longum subsp. suillum]|uniref:hypothetical protein n=1 Tax=Bifidobacterium longum TaxID=216816 RepID=UPI00197F1CD5|nr:hypothetical protein [Bifidobacterium longum]QSG86154.1 hypothetical protein BLS995_05490 [Bifidobacterium longum subsp. suillum]
MVDLSASFCGADWLRPRVEYLIGTKILGVLVKIGLSLFGVGEWVGGVVVLVG